MQHGKHDRCRFWCGKTENFALPRFDGKIGNEQRRKKKHSNEPETPDFQFIVYKHKQWVLSQKVVATSECVELSNRDPIVADMWFLFVLYMRFNKIYVVCT